MSKTTKITDLPLTGLDFEGAGSWGGMEDQPVQIGFAHMLADKITHKYSSYLYVDRPISRFATRVHRITNNMIIGKPTLIQIWPEIRPWWCKSIIVAHNIATEKKFTSIFNLSGKPIWIDTLKIARAQQPHLEKHSLSELLKHFKLNESIKQECKLEAHDALFDAIGCLYLLKALLKVPGWENLTVEQAQGLSLKTFNKHVQYRKQQKYRQKT